MIFPQHPILDGLAVAFAAFVITWSVALIVRTLKVAPQLYYQEKERADQLTETIRPKLKCSFGKDVPGCVRQNSTLTLPYIDHSGKPHQISAPCTYYRVKIEANGVGHVPACSGRLVSIKRGMSTTLDGENLELTLAPAERPNPLVKDINDGTAEYLDVLAITDANLIFITTQQFMYPSSIDFEQVFSGPGEYLLRIIVSSPISISVPIDLLLKWTGDWKTAEMSCHAANI